MKFYPAKEVRQFIVLNETSVRTLRQRWNRLRISGLRNSEEGVQVENAEEIPTNKDVFEFIKSRVDARDPNFKVEPYNKFGIFAKRMTGLEEQVKLSHTSTKADEGMLFVYQSPWSTEVAFQHLTIGAGDAFVYRPNVGGGRV